MAVPKPGDRCPFSGLSRSTLNELIIPGPANDHLPPVKSSVIKKRGALRGIRLISYDSLMQYIEALSVEVAESPRASETSSVITLKEVLS